MFVFLTHRVLITQSSAILLWLVQTNEALLQRGKYMKLFNIHFITPLQSPCNFYIPPLPAPDPSLPWAASNKVRQRSKASVLRDATE